MLDILSCTFSLEGLKWDERRQGGLLDRIVGALCSNVGHESVKGKYYYPIKGHKEVRDSIRKKKHVNKSTIKQKIYWTKRCGAV